jgi:hypothetical protein
MATTWPNRISTNVSVEPIGKVFRGVTRKIWLFGGVGF